MQPCAGKPGAGGGGERGFFLVLDVWCGCQWPWLLRQLCDLQVEQSD
jgi:hypothetical protein